MWTVIRLTWKMEGSRVSATSVWSVHLPLRRRINITLTLDSMGPIKSKNFSLSNMNSLLLIFNQVINVLELWLNKPCFMIGRYKCTVCDYAVTYYANYIQHLKKHENQRNIPTDLLNLGRKRHQDEDGNGSLLKVPKVVENGENSSTGSVSGASVGSVDSNENHNSSLLKCCYCPFHCFDEATLDTHLIHHQDNPNWLHVCHICTFRTSSKKSLKEHSKVHLSNTYQHWQNGGEQEKHVNGGLVATKKREYLNGFGDNGHTKSHQYQKGNGHDDSSNGSLWRNCTSSSTPTMSTLKKKIIHSAWSKEMSSK